MKKNVIITFTSHIVIGIICYISEIVVYGTFMSDSGALYDPRFTVIFCILAIAQLAGVIALYFTAGYRFIKPTKSKIGTAISIWFLAIIFILMYTVSVLNLFNNEYYFKLIYIFTNPIAYGLLLGQAFLVSNISVVENSLISDVLYWICIAISLLIPSGGIWLGMLARRKKAAKIQKPKEKDSLQFWNIK